MSQFGLMDAILDEKLGFTPKREEGDHKSTVKSYMDEDTANALLEDMDFHYNKVKCPIA